MKKFLLSLEKTWDVDKGYLVIEANSVEEAKKLWEDGEVDEAEIEQDPPDQQQWDLVEISEVDKT